MRGAVAADASIAIEALAVREAFADERCCGLREHRKVI
jgi:hypothetical protein